MGVHQDKETYDKIKDILEIPADEPIFIIRAQDKFAVSILKTYHKLVRDSIRPQHRSDNFFPWLGQIVSIISDFMNWQHDNKEKVKVPD